MNGHPRFFGYGSLVNLATHDYHDARPARLRGWRRVWRHTSLRPAAFLSVEPCDATVIDGVIAAVPGADWAALDLRERAYARRDVSHLVDHDGDRGETAVYQVEEGHLAAPTLTHPVYLSYLDVVVQGFLHTLGQAAVERFFETTHGWDAPILMDRAAPRYPRHQRLTPAEVALVDDWLRQIGARVVEPDDSPLAPAD